MTGQRFARRVPADARRIADLRHALTGWLTRLNPRLPDELCEDVVLASYEAMANSTEHAYLAGPVGEVDVMAVYRPDELTVEVADFGDWKPPGDDPFRGRGLSLIKALTTSHNLDRGPRGTRVSMSWQLSGP